MIAFCIRAVALIFSLWCAALLLFTWPEFGRATAIVVAVLGAAAVPAWRWAGFFRGLWLAAIAACLVWWNRITPSNERNWKPSVEILPYAEINGDEITVHNIRNFHYRSESDFDRNYYDKKFNLSEISGVDVFTSYWSSDLIAHIMVSFAFREEDFIAFSIETRNEESESYSTWGGFFRQYELTFVAADERDLIGLRTTHRQPNEQVYLFRTATKLENAQRFFLSYIERINQLKEAPEFYNTMTTNCSTSVLLCTSAFPNKIPVTWQVFVSGFFPEYLYGLGTLDKNYSLEDLKGLGHVNQRSVQAGYADDYSLRIRAGVPRRQPLPLPSKSAITSSIR
ncbi:MAG: hypothetical protein DCC75_01540 [Proteobacteria bacterium]|nr:MAG: hypothetical protein DCC75_01540 [Pseudomonadota bacterium]